MSSLLGEIASSVNRAPVPYISRGEEGTRLLFGRRDNKKRHMEAMRSTGTLFAIVDALSEAVGQLEWRLYQKNRDGRRRFGPDTGERTEVTRHQALEVWNNPNPFYDQTTFVEAVQQHYELAGEQWWIMYKPQGLAFPTEMWPVRPDRMEPVPDRRDFISGYIYHGPDGEDIPLEIDEVLFMRKPDPLDPYRGQSAVQSILEDLESANASSTWVRNFFLNSAEPGGIIEVEKTLDDNEFERLRKRWNEQHKGVSRAHRVAILEQGKWVDRKFTMREMQFDSLRNVTRDTIREAFRFPKPLLGSVDDINRANSEAAEVHFARWLVVPRARRLRTVLNTGFLPLFGSAATGLEFDFDDPVPEDAEAVDRARDSKSQAAVALAEAGWDPDEVLEAMELPEMEFVGPATPPPAEVTTELASDPEQDPNTDPDDPDDEPEE